LAQDSSRLDEEIRHALTEIRMVLPGAQALLGFQFVTLLLEDFSRLPESLKQVHLLSLALMTIAVVLLMTPAAYHRIVEKGENTERFHRFASRMLMASLIPMGFGFATDFYIVVWKVTDSGVWAWTATLVLLAMIFGFWFGLPLYRRCRKSAGRAS
jgi:Family of unknown function (DUF6328)